MFKYQIIIALVLFNICFTMSAAEAKSQIDKIVEIQLDRRKHIGRVDKEYNRRRLLSQGRRLAYEYEVDVSNDHNY